MSRGLSSTLLAAVAAKTIRPAIFVFMDFASGAVRAWTGKGDFTWGGNTYAGIGSFGGISEVEETGNPVANGLTLTLSGIPSTLLATSLDRTQYRGRRVRVWHGFFNVTGDTAALIDTPVASFAGRMDVMTPTDTGETSTIALTCENRLVDLERSRERRYTDADMQQLNPGDGSFRYVAGLQDKQFNWGQATDSGATAGAPSTYAQGYQR
jgi:hypothetical protein